MENIIQVIQVNETTLKVIFQFLTWNEELQEQEWASSSAFVPMDEENDDYRAVLRWVANGGVIEQL